MASVLAQIQLHAQQGQRQPKLAADFSGTWIKVWVYTAKADACV